jgi:DNA-binding NarL/FixJ family response regulator
MITVAMVEDDPDTSRLIGELLEAGGFRCVAKYSSAETAIRGLVGDRPDIVLMDVNLAASSGIDCIRHLKPLLPEVKFVMLTMYDDSDNIFEALSAGAVGYVLKRAAPLELIKSLHDVMEGGSPMTSSVARKVVQAFQRPPGAAPEVEQLSVRERQVLHLLAQGQFYKEIADSLGIANNTVHSYIRRIYEKLHVRSRMEAVAKLGGTGFARPERAKPQWR